MNYKLAKQLKEAGMKWENVDLFDMKGNEIQTENYPTLSEIIEACEKGWQIFGLNKFEEGWIAVVDNYDHYKNVCGEFSKDKATAVAKLYLKLNGKSINGTNKS